MNRRVALSEVDLAGLSVFPRLTCLLTSTFEDKRAGIVVNRVQRCGDEPPLISVACPKVESLEPLIRESHSFGLCVIREDQRSIARLFQRHAAPDDEFDRFASLPVQSLVTGAPILSRCVGFDCEVVRHVDIESEEELFIGRVVATHTP